MPPSVTTNSPRRAKVGAIDRADRQRHRLQGMAGVAAAKMLAPADVEAAVRGSQRRDVDAALAQRLDPGAVRSELRPARPAERQDPGIAAPPRHRPAGRVRRSERGSSPQPVQRWRACTRTPGFAQAVQPGAQQRRGLHVDREDAVRCCRRRSARPGPRPRPAPPRGRMLRARLRPLPGAPGSGRAKAASGSPWVRLSPPRPASRNLRPTEGIAS